MDSSTILCVCVFILPRLAFKLYTGQVTNELYAKINQIIVVLLLLLLKRTRELLDTMFTKVGHRLPKQYTVIFFFVFISMW